MSRWHAWLFGRTMTCQLKPWLHWRYLAGARPILPTSWALVPKPFFNAVDLHHPSSAIAR